MSERLPAEFLSEETQPSPERHSGLVHIINVSPEQAQAGRDAFANLLRHQSFESFEREKTPVEREIIARILTSMPEFVSLYGGRPVTGLAETNFHIIDANLLPGDQQEAVLGADVAGLYDMSRQRLMILPDSRSPLTTAQRMVHETLHLESFLSFTAEDGTSMGQAGKVLLHPRRIGISAFNQKHTKRFFRGIDEAVIEELTARFDEQYFALIPALEAEVRRRERVRNTTGALDRNQIASVVDTEHCGGPWETSIHTWRYGAERKMLAGLMAQLHDANADQFASREAVFALFAKAVFTGKLLDLARLIEKTLGKGTMRALAAQTMLANAEDGVSPAGS